MATNPADLFRRLQSQALLQQPRDIQPGRVSSGVTRVPNVAAISPQSQPGRGIESAAASIAEALIQRNQQEQQNQQQRQLAQNLFGQAQPFEEANPQEFPGVRAGIQTQEIAGTTPTPQRGLLGNQPGLRRLASSGGLSVAVDIAQQRQQKQEPGDLLTFADQQGNVLGQAREGSRDAQRFRQQGGIIVNQPGLGDVGQESDLPPIQRDADLLQRELDLPRADAVAAASGDLVIGKDQEGRTVRINRLTNQTTPIGQQEANRLEGAGVGRADQEREPGTIPLAEQDIPGFSQQDVTDAIGGATGPADAFQRLLSRIPVLGQLTGVGGDQRQARLAIESFRNNLISTFAPNADEGRVSNFALQQALRLVPATQAFSTDQAAVDDFQQVTTELDREIQAQERRLQTIQSDDERQKTRQFLNDLQLIKNQASGLLIGRALATQDLSILSDDQLNALERLTSGN